MSSAPTPAMAASRRTIWSFSTIRCTLFRPTMPYCWFRPKPRVNPDSWRRSRDCLASLMLKQCAKRIGKSMWRAAGHGKPGRSCSSKSGEGGNMPRNLCVCALVVLLAAVSRAQEPKPAQKRDEKLRKEILSMMKEDQDARQAVIQSGQPDKDAVKRVAELDRKNTARMKE